uniref:Uncharacterized protein n=1 Tax=Anopheles atroparvus TaxID=41427 RepID=A0AAG5CS37_ANOAO
MACSGADCGQIAHRCPPPPGGNNMLGQACAAPTTSFISFEELFLDVRPILAPSSWSTVVRWRVVKLD